MTKYSMSLDFHDKYAGDADSRIITKIGITKEEVFFEYKEDVLATATWDQMFRMYFLTHPQHKDFTVQDIMGLRE